MSGAGGFMAMVSHRRHLLNFISKASEILDNNTASNSFLSVVGNVDNLDNPSCQTAPSPLCNTMCIYKSGSQKPLVLKDLYLGSLIYRFSVIIWCYSLENTKCSISFQHLITETCGKTLSAIATRIWPGFTNKLPVETTWISIKLKNQFIYVVWSPGILFLFILFSLSFQFTVLRSMSALC